MDLKLAAQHGFAKFHRSLYQLSRGRIGRRLGKTEHILLTTIGRKSGQPRTTPLTIVVDGARTAIVASNGGAPNHPAWYMNLLANPEVTVQRGADKMAMRARTADASERDALWARAVATYQGYEGYKAKTSREIPIVLLEKA